MNYKKFLAGLLSVAMFLPSVQCVTANNSDNSKTMSNNFGKKFDKKTKAGIGIGSGALLILGASGLVYGIHEHQKNGTLKEQTRKAVEGGKSYYIKDGIIPLHMALPIGKDSVSAFYYGKDAFKNLVLDTQEKARNTKKSCKNSTCVVRNLNSKYVFCEPERTLYDKAQTRRFVQMCTIPWGLFVEFGQAESMYRLADAGELSDKEKNEENEKSEYDYLHFRPTYNIFTGNYVIVRVHKTKNTVEWKYIYTFIGSAAEKWAPLNYDSGNDVWSAQDINVSGDRK